MRLTVFTPTYNRVHTIGHLFDSLCRQDCADFEWLVVDDGSTDGTEAVVEGFKTRAPFDIRYCRLSHGGKHRAYNQALELAKGELFFVVDSDDYVPDNCLTIVSEAYPQLMEDEKICGLIALKARPDGSNFGVDIADDEIVDTWHKYDKCVCRGERSFVFKTAIARRFPFPEFEGESFVTESTIYDQFVGDYAFLTLNRSLTTCTYLPNGLSSDICRLMYANPRGFIAYHSQRISRSEHWREALKHALRYQAFKAIAGDGERYEGRYSTLVNLLEPVGQLGKWYYKSRCKSR